MKVGYTEFSYGYAFAESLIRASPTAPKGARPSSPTFQQEGHSARKDGSPMTSSSRPQTPDVLVREIEATLRVADGTDIALLDILAHHVLKLNPAATAVADAARAIEALAAARAKGPNDATDHP